MGDDPSGYGGRLRKRRRATDGAEEAVKALLELTDTCGRMVIFTGSGLSANSGMSMFSTKNGLYERARQKFKITDGIKLFSYPFYKQRKTDVQAFFAQIYSEAQSSRAAPGHVAIAQLHELGRLQRHYTLNIDGLAGAVGMDTWHHEHNPEGITVEMHGNISYVVCPSCHAVERLSGDVMEAMKSAGAVTCGACKEDDMRFKVMLYDDEEGDCITPEDVFERLEDDLAAAGAVLWVGISFEQSASTEYFRKVRHLLASLGRLEQVTQVIINPSDEAYFNVLSSMSKKEDVRVIDVRSTSDEVLPRMVQHLHRTSGTKPGAQAAKAARVAAHAATAAASARRAAQAREAAAAARAAPRRRSSGSMSSASLGGSAEQPARAAAARAEPGDGAAADEAAAAGAAESHLPASAALPGPTELAAMDSAAAAAIALPAAVQKHLLQQQLRHQLQHLQQQLAPAAPQQQPAALPPGSVADSSGDAGGGQQHTLPAGAAPIKQEQPVLAAPPAAPPPAAAAGLQGLLAALGAGSGGSQPHAPAVAAAAKQEPQPAVPPLAPLLPPAASVGLQGLLAALGGGIAQPPSASLPDAAPGSFQLPALQQELPAVQPLAVQPLSPPAPPAAVPASQAASGLAAVLATPAVAGLLLSSPALVAALAAAAAAANGAPPAAAAAAGAVASAALASSAAAAAAAAPANGRLPACNGSSADDAGAATAAAPAQPGLPAAADGGSSRSTPTAAPDGGVHPQLAAVNGVR